MITQTILQLKKQRKVFLSLMCLLMVLIIGGCSSRKLHTVKVEAEANKILDVLSENQIKAQKVETGEGDRKTYEIWIDGGDLENEAAIRLMEDNCLGQPEHEPIEGSAIVTSMTTEKARENLRRKIDMEDQLRQIPGATCVTVNLVSPEDRTLSLNPYPSSATVQINYKTPTFVYNEEKIANMVAKGFPALKAENVEVALSPKPIRPLPDFQSGYQFRRMALVTGIGSAIILSFAAIVFFLQKKRKKAAPAFAEGEGDVYENEEQVNRAGLLNNIYDSDEDDDDDGIKLR